jgi:hypothetical protein
VLLCERGDRLLRAKPRLRHAMVSAAARQLGSATESAFLQALLRL